MKRLCSHNQSGPSGIMQKLHPESLVKLENWKFSTTRKAGFVCNLVVAMTIWNPLAISLSNRLNLTMGESRDEKFFERKNPLLMTRSWVPKGWLVHYKLSNGHIGIRPQFCGFYGMQEKGQFSQAPLDSAPGNPPVSKVQDVISYQQHLLALLTTTLFAETR